MSVSEPVPWNVLLAQLAEGGLDLHGVAPRPGAPGAIVVVGNGGGALWERFVAWLKEDPERLRVEPHPLDRYVASRIEALPAHPERRWVLATDPTLPLRGLARQAGLGWPSRLGLLLHPRYGPWVALRAACFTSEALPVTGPLPGCGPCEGCPAPCIPACPGGAVRAEGFALSACAKVHQQTTLCARTCHAREACPVGADRRYPPLAVRYHHDPAGGRAALAESLGFSTAPGTPRDWAPFLDS